MKKLSFAVSLAVVILLPSFLQAAEPLATLLVVPARQVMVQLAFDIQSIRKADVVSWRATSDPEAPELNHWDGKKWDTITLEQFKKGMGLARKPQKVIFMGLDTPSVLTELPELPGVVRFETFDPATLVNNLDAFYAFSNGEWRWLSTKYSFMLRDVNAKVREQNRYNKPPQEEPVPKRPPVLFEKNPAPADVIKPARGTKSVHATPKSESTAPAEIVMPKPDPTSPVDVMTKPASVPAPPVATPAGTNAVPAAR